MSYKGSNGNFDAALIQLIRKLSDASNFFSGEHSEVRKFARSLLRDWDHTRGTDWYTSTNKEEGTMSQTVPLHTADSAKPEVNLSSDERVAALCDLSYCAGLKAGWNYCADGDQTGFERSMESTREAVAVLNEHRQKDGEKIQRERELFEQYKKQRAPGANLQRIGDEYADLDVQWHFETWLARATMSIKKEKPDD